MIPSCLLPAIPSSHSTALPIDSTVTVHAVSLVNEFGEGKLDPSPILWFWLVIWSGSGIIGSIFVVVFLKSWFSVWFRVKGWRCYWLDSLLIDLEPASSELIMNWLGDQRRFCDDVFFLFFFKLTIIETLAGFCYWKLMKMDTSRAGNCLFLTSCWFISSVSHFVEGGRSTADARRAATARRRNRRHPPTTTKTSSKIYASPASSSASTSRPNARSSSPRIRNPPTTVCHTALTKVIFILYNFIFILVSFQYHLISLSFFFFFFLI